METRTVVLGNHAGQSGVNSINDQMVHFLLPEVGRFRVAEVVVRETCIEGSNEIEDSVTTTAERQWAKGRR